MTLMFLQDDVYVKIYPEVLYRKLIQQLLKPSRSFVRVQPGRTEFEALLSGMTRGY